MVSFEHLACSLYISTRLKTFLEDLEQALQAVAAAKGPAADGGAAGVTLQAESKGVATLKRKLRERKSG